MSEPLFQRMKRVVSAGVEGAVGKAERAAAPSLMRHSIREVEELIDQARADQAAARQRADAAVSDQKALRARLAELEEQARFALGKDRPDLAEAALTRQVEIEADLDRLDGVRSESARAIALLEDEIGKLAARKSEMDRQFATFEAARRAAAGNPGSPIPDRGRRADRAGQAFDRAMAATAAEALQEAEIDALRRESLVAERLAALRDGTRPAKAAKRKKS